MHFFLISYSLYVNNLKNIFRILGSILGIKEGLFFVSGMYVKDVQFWGRFTDSITEMEMLEGTCDFHFSNGAADEALTEQKDKNLLTCVQGELD